MSGLFFVYNSWKFLVVSGAFFILKSAPLSFIVLPLIPA